MREEEEEKESRPALLKVGINHAAANDVFKDVTLLGLIWALYLRGEIKSKFIPQCTKSGVMWHLRIQRIDICTFSRDAAARKSEWHEILGAEYELVSTGF